MVFQDRQCNGLDQLVSSKYLSSFTMFPIIVFFFANCSGERRTEFAPPSNTAVIEITHATRENTGSYICKGSNTAGETEKRIELLVNDYPKRGDVIGNKCSLNLILWF